MPPRDTQPLHQTHGQPLESPAPRTVRAVNPLHPARAQSRLAADAYIDHAPGACRERRDTETRAVHANDGAQYSFGIMNHGPWKVSSNCSAIPRRHTDYGRHMGPPSVVRLARMPQQFLSNLDIDTERSQIRCQRMTKAVPANLFSNDSDPCKSRSNAFFENAVRAEGPPPFERGFRETMVACLNGPSIHVGAQKAKRSGMVLL